MLLLLRLDIGGKQPPQLSLPGLAPRKKRAEHVFQRKLGIDRARVDRKASALHRKAFLRLGETEVVANEIHQIGGILAIVNCEGSVQANGVGTLAEEARTNRVKPSRPDDRTRHCPPAL